MLAGKQRGERICVHEINQSCIKTSNGSYSHELRITNSAFELPSKSLVFHERTDLKNKTQNEREEATGSKTMFSLSWLERSEWIPAFCLIFTTRVDPTLGSTFFKLILFEKSRVELEFVFLIFTTRVRKHLGNSGRFPPLRRTS